MLPHARTVVEHLRRLTSPTASDAVLLGRWLGSRDQDAFTSLVARHGPMVLGVCRRVLGDAQHAEDAFQAAFLVLARRAARVRRPEALASFLYGVALRLARKARSRRCGLPSGSGIPEPTDPHPDPLDVLSGRELLALLDEEVGRLPERYRLPVLLCVLQERTVEEAAALLGWSVGSVRGRLTRGRDRLRQRLARRGVCLNAAGAALLMSAAVPEHLLAACVRNLTGPVSGAVGALAGGAILKPLILSLGVLALVMVGLGTGLAMLLQPIPEVPSAPIPAAPPVPAAQELRRDRLGDPLPPGAIARLGTLRFRAPDAVEALAFAPDGKTIAASARAGVFLFDTDSGKRLKHLPTSEAAWGRDNPLVFSPDGKRLAGRGQSAIGHQHKGVVRVWELAGSRKPQEYAADNAVWVGWSPDGEPLAVCLEAGALCLRDLAAGRVRRFESRDLPRPELSAYAVCDCAAAGKTLAVADEQNVVHAWDTATGRERCTCRPKGGRVWSLSLSPDGTCLLSISDQVLQMWDLTTAKVIYTADSDDKYCVARFSRDGKTLAVVDSRQVVCFWDAATGRERSRTKDHSSFGSGFALSPDGKTMATTERHAGAIHLWDVPAGTQKPEPVGHRCGPHGNSFSPDGRRVATGGNLDGTVHLWDLATGESVAHVDRPGLWVRDCAFSRDGRALFSTWTDDSLWVCDAAGGEQRHVLKLEDPERPDSRQSAISMRLSDDGKTLVAFSFYYPKGQGAGPNYHDTLITGWDASTRRQLFRRRLPGMDSWFALSPEARVLALSHPPVPPDRVIGKGPMRLEDLASGEHLLTFPTLEGQTWPMAFSPDGRLLASNNCKPPDKENISGRLVNTLRLWETAPAAEVLALPAADNDRAAFSPDGRLLAHAAPGQEIVVWDLARGREWRRWKGFDAEVTSLAFSPDSRRLISGLSDSTLLVWDVGPREAAIKKPEADNLTKAWADLGGEAPRALQARWTLTAAPEETLALMKDRLRPVPEVDPQRLRRLLADLDSDEFAVRDKARVALEELGDLAEPALREALAGHPTLELRQRAKPLLERLQGPVTRPEVLRGLRAVAVLEGIGTPPARRLLEELAAGAAGARLTREAKASLRRLDLRSPPDR